MNLLLLLIGLRPWRAASSVSLFTRVFVAIGAFSVEMQVVTWLGVGTLRTLPLLNALVAILALAFGRRVVARLGTESAFRPWWLEAPSDAVPLFKAVPWVATLLLAVLVLALNIGRPLEAADPYHLEKVDQIERVGTLAYDVRADPKINVLSSVYELVFADIRQIPVAGPALARVHGIAALFLYLLAIAATRELLRAGPGWHWAAMLAVPVVFHQLVLVKNDLFAGLPGLVVLAWVVARSRTAPPREFVWASWLAGLVVAVKLTSLPLLLLVVGAAFVYRLEKRFVRVALGSALGLVSGGLFFVLVQNTLTYGNPMPVGDLGNQYAGLTDRAVGVWRFGVSLVDLGLLTRIWWPGRGGWGGTFGLPLVWAAVMLVLRARKEPEARGALLCAGLHFLAFAAAFPDADIAQRLALAPGLMLMAVALSGLQRDAGWKRPAAASLVVVIVLSGVQIARSAYLYLVTSPG